MKYLINFLHVIVAIVIVLVCWVGSAQGYVRTFGNDDMAIVVAAMGMVIGVWSAMAYLFKFGR